MELSDQARAQFLKWREEREDKTGAAFAPTTDEILQALPAEEQTTSYPASPAAESSPADLIETLPRDTETEPARIYQEPEPAGSELAKSLRFTGYSVSMIATKMNLDVETVKKYLGMV